MLEIINNTLPKRKKPSDQDGAKTESGAETGAASPAEGEVSSAPVDATALDITSMAVSDGSGVGAGKGTVRVPAGQDATIIDYSSAMKSAQDVTAAKSGGQPSKGSTTNVENASKSQEGAEKSTDCTILDYTALKKS